MSATRRGHPSRTLWALAAILILLAAGASAQESFRITYDVDRSNAEQFQVKGVVHNDSHQEVLDVSVTAEALDARGKVVARGIAYVSSRIDGRSSAPFVIKVPGVATATRFRVSVSSFRSGLGTQAG
jgi:hypothetical protein